VQAHLLVREALFEFDLLLHLLKIYVVVPDLGGVVDFRADVVFLLNDGVVLVEEEVRTLHFSHAGGKAEVGNYQFPLFVNEEVLRLDVAVDDAVGVEVADSLQQLVEDIPGGGFVKSFRLLDETVELPVLRQFHHVVT
jgi:hypothetical protein